MAEVEVLRLKDLNNAATLQDLEEMFRDGPEMQIEEMREIHLQLCSLNERFTEQTYDLQRQIAEMQANTRHLETYADANGCNSKQQRSRNDEKLDQSR